MKSYTDLEQSKKLAETLQLESADMYWIHVDDGGDRDFWKVETIQLSWRPYKGIKDNYIPAWSFAALFDALPDGTDIVKEEADTENEKYMCTVGVKDDIISTFGNNPVDACVPMIEKLHELKML